MPLYEKENFLEEVLRLIRFPFDREEIRAELENHITDRTNYYKEQGYNQESAAGLAVKNMGEAKEIGRALNKQHNPVLGWLWLVTNGLAFILAILVILNLAIPFLSSLLSLNGIDKIPASDIIYQIDANEKVRLDDTVIRFTEVVYDKDGDLNIYYKYYDTRLWGLGWSLPGIGSISDNLGNQYLTGGSSGNGGVISRNRQVIPDFAAAADTLIIDYDSYNRKYRVEIPLQEGDENEQTK